jgi:polyisoprenoid-binding protein YceI
MKHLKLQLLTLLAGFSVMLAACSGGGNQSSGSMETENTSDTESSAEVRTMQIDTAASEVKWEGNMLGLYAHSGLVNLQDGMLKVQGDKITGGSFTVDMKSITPTDDSYEPEKGRTKEKLVGHLSSDDFFAVEENPTATFEITNHNPENNTISGNLTIRGTTHQEIVENVSFDPESGTASGTLTFDRSKYNVNFQMTAQDMVLSNDIKLDIDLKSQS